MDIESPQVSDDLPEETEEAATGDDPDAGEPIPELVSQWHMIYIQCHFVFCALSAKRETASPP